jgi:hypothetical protein
MRIYRGKRCQVVSASGYVMGAKMIATYVASGDRYLVLKIDYRVRVQRQRPLRVVAKRPASRAG